MLFRAGFCGRGNGSGGASSIPVRFRNSVRASGSAPGEQAAAGQNVIEQLRADVEASGELRLGQAVIV